MKKKKKEDLTGNFFNLKNFISWGYFNKEGGNFKETLALF